ncbi:MAG: hypothetical protein AUG08_09335 [Acidobacteria bacterium 13_1_20CM_2_55_15]|nr:MAG: hypothetical protein AUH28_17640 [Acidobacteria bacterium 13_1_40CM_56_16]OLD22315.1 MAG: hypothetical protein AUI91_02345 [Acidobacteria bacterium 13_1_40CM_3_56_11]OLD69831.1 MAG: hypothetical protein AUI45_06355 [Acidobacteria bacterium 13_1_40CM_2_56_11]OLE88219.1 MAG: hypothetical protein AUG08_09335 [Acidobacteria bacterium 13_1_20CM_2_55_15]
MMESNQNLMLKIAAAANFVLVLALGYGLSSINGTLTDRIAKVESANEETQAENEKTLEVRALENDKTIKGLLADLDQVKKRVGMTAVELNHTQKQAQTLKQQQELSSKEFATQLASKASSSDVDVFRQEATNQIAEVQRDSDAKYGTVSGEVTGIKRDLLATRDDLGRQLTDVTNVLSERIAKNSGELAELRKKGDRDYFEFDIRKNSKQPLHRVADLQLALLKTDPKKHRYNVAIQVDDNRLEKKDRTTNEPVQFLVGREQLRYEVVVNSVEKDRIRGYVSAPKDKVLSAEVPRFRLQ